MHSEESVEDMDKDQLQEEVGHVSKIKSKMDSDESSCDLTLHRL